MPDKPAAEVVIDEALVRRLLDRQAGAAVPDAERLALVKVAEGWDNEVWRLGAGAAVRLPRRALAAPLVLNEQRVLTLIAPPIEALGVRVPVPLVAGRPTADYPWAWSVVPWIDGVRGLEVARAERGRWAASLAAALDALHRAAPAGHPVNPVRGRPLHTRSTAFAERLEGLRSSGLLDARAAHALDGIWSRGLAQPPWHEKPVWIHGDLHPGNLVSRDGRLAGIIDFGDVTAGDPAYDLGVAWIAFDAAGREVFREASGTRYDAATWTRAHAWAAAIGVMLLAHSDDAPDYASLGSETVREVVADASR